MKGSSQMSSYDKTIPQGCCYANVRTENVILIYNYFLVVYRVPWASYLIKYILSSGLEYKLLHVLILIDLCCLWVGQMTHGKVVLVTAATLGTWPFIVQVNWYYFDIVCISFSVWCIAQLLIISKLYLERIIQLLDVPYKTCTR
jgi:hypothetical protein